MNGTKINLCFLIVIYGKEVKSSKTIESLANFSAAIDAKLIIYNNGPDFISIEKEKENNLNRVFNEVILVNDLSNAPLSKVYNNVIGRNANFSHYIILDDDTSLSESYIKLIYNIENYNSYDIILPGIYSEDGNTKFYPKSRDGVIKNDESTVNSKTILSITSGIIINRTFVNKIKNNDVFDESYALYGVDTSFFKKIWFYTKQGININIITTSSITHSLSRIENKDSEFRRIERLYDLSISARKYPSIITSFFYLKKMIVSVLTYNKKEFFALIYGFYYGKHPKC